ncbi:hypothetical protein SK128_009661 [Halocaridina rubra]|uniref:Uncharacterized protein n=1 Tax=Halocaridina rubra TaxID=373956 RepID=A0AAN8XDN5_HALRR
MDSMNTTKTDFIFLSLNIIACVTCFYWQRLAFRYLHQRYFSSSLPSAKVKYPCFRKSSREPSTNMCFNLGFFKPVEKEVMNVDHAIARDAVGLSRSELLKDNTKMCNYIRSLQKQLAKVNDEKKLLQEKIPAFENELQTVNKQNQALQFRAATLEEDCRTYKCKITKDEDLRKKRENLGCQNQVQVYNDEGMQRLREELKRKQEKVSDLENKIESMIDVYVKNKQEYKNLANNFVRERDEHLQETNRLRDQLRMKHNVAQQKVRELKNQVQSLHEEREQIMSAVRQVSLNARQVLKYYQDIVENIFKQVFEYVNRLIQQRDYALSTMAGHPHDFHKQKARLYKDFGSKMEELKVIAESKHRALWKEFFPADPSKSDDDIPADIEIEADVWKEFFPADPSKSDEDIPADIEIEADVTLLLWKEFFPADPSKSDEDIPADIEIEADVWKEFFPADPSKSDDDIPADIEIEADVWKEFFPADPSKSDEDIPADIEVEADVWKEFFPDDPSKSDEDIPADIEIEADVWKFFPADPSKSDEDIPADIETEADVVDNDPDYQQHQIILFYSGRSSSRLTPARVTKTFLQTSKLKLMLWTMILIISNTK